MGAPTFTGGASPDGYTESQSNGGFGGGGGGGSAYGGGGGGGGGGYSGGGGGAPGGSSGGGGGTLPYPASGAGGGSYFSPSGTDETYVLSAGYGNGEVIITGGDSSPPTVPDTASTLALLAVGILGLVAGQRRQRPARA